MATHEICSLEEADKVLVQEDYKGNHKIYYVKEIQNLDINTLRWVGWYTTRIQVVIYDFFVSSISDKNS